MASDGQRIVLESGDRYIIERININGRWFVREDRFTQAQAERDALVERVRVLEEYLQGRATCGCCGGVYECTPACRLGDDDPEAADAMEYARSLFPQRQQKGDGGP